MSSSARDPGGNTCVLIGAGGHAASVRAVVESAGWEVAFASTASPEPLWFGELIDDDSLAIERAQAQGRHILIAIGANDIRAGLLDRIPDGVLSPAITSPTATVAASVSLGAGTVVHHHAHVGPRSNVGRGTIINTGAIVEHDCTIGEAAHIAPGACVLGGAVVGREALIGSGARVLPGVRIGDKATVGAGAIVTKDVSDGFTVIGNPARLLEC